MQQRCRSQFVNGYMDMLRQACNMVTQHNVQAVVLAREKALRAGLAEPQSAVAVTGGLTKYT